MNTVLSEWNGAPEDEAMMSMLACCGANRWARAMIAARPLASFDAFYLKADEVWSEMSEEDWLQAFACHPRIGEHTAPHASSASVAWSRQEQASAATATQSLLAGLAERNAEYEKKFGFRYIVCATGKSANDMLAILERRLERDRDSELREAAEQQRQIMHIRLRKWLEV